MFPKQNPTNTQAWLLLKRHYDEEMQRTHLRKLFAADPERFKKFSTRLTIFYLIIQKILLIIKHFNCCFNWLKNAR